MNESPGLFMFTLLVYLCLYLNNVLSFTIVFGQIIINGNTEGTLVNFSNTFFPIQQTIAWILSFLKNVLTCTVLLIGVSIVMGCILYDNDDISLQQKPSKTRKRRILKKSRSDQRLSLNDSFEPKPSEKQILGTDRVSIETELQSSKIFQNNQPERGWVCTQCGSKWVWMYHVDLQKKANEQENHPIPKMIILNDSFIPFQYSHQLWINSGFYTLPELVVLAKTSKTSYLRFKKLPDLGKRKTNSYMLHPAYKTCAIDMMSRAYLIEGHMDIKIDTDFILGIFDCQFNELIDRASEAGEDVSYESFRRIHLSSSIIWNMAIRYFLTHEFLKKPKWTLEELRNSKNALKEELERAVKYYLQFPNYDFIPQKQEVNQGVYEILLKKMELMNVPFCHCPHISRLLISSQDASLGLFLFWDIFEALRMKILTQAEMLTSEILSLKETAYIACLIDRISEVYNNQNRKYLSSLYFEMVDFIQHDFFKNNQRYGNSWSEEQYRFAFDDYMLYIRALVEAFLAAEVFIRLPIGIIV